MAIHRQIFIQLHRNAALYKDVNISLQSDIVLSMQNTETDRQMAVWSKVYFPMTLFINLRMEKGLVPISFFVSGKEPWKMGYWPAVFWKHQQTIS